MNIDLGGDSVSLDGWAKRLHKRGRSARLQAYGFLALVLILLAAGALVFQKAPQITSSDLNGNVEKRISDANASAQSIREESNRLGQDMYLNSSPILIQLRKIFGEWFSRHPHDDYTPEPDEYRLNAISVAFSQPLSRKLMSDSIRKQVDDLQKGSDKSILASQIGFAGNIVGMGRASKLEWYELASMIDAWKDFSFDEQKLAKEATRLEVLRVQEGGLNRLLEALETKKTHDAVYGSEDSAGDVGQGSLIRLIQTNITRFGTLAIITFIVSVLVPLYRYNMRLYHFYMARADAAEVLNSRFDAQTFAQFSASLTPAFDFGKMPSTPTEQIIELIRLGTNAKHR